MEIVNHQCISQQTMCGDNKGLDADMETHNEAIKSKHHIYQLSKAKELL